MKQKRYWLRGLFVGFIVSMLYAINLVGKTQCYSETCEIIKRMQLGAIFLPSYLLSIPFMTFYILLPTVIGIVCGVIYGQIMKRNQVGTITN